MEYEYYCGMCELKMVRRFKIGCAPVEVECPECAGQAQRVYTAPSVVYRGSGWVGHGVPDRDERAKQPGPLDFSDLGEGE